MAIKNLVKLSLMLGRVILHPDSHHKIVFYHDIGTGNTPMGTPEKLFWAHMRILGYDESLSSGRGHRVAFDDGFRGIWTEREKLKVAGIRPLVFVAIRLVGQKGYLTWDEILALQNEYGFDFQCHTWSHQTLIGDMIDESPIEERTEAWYARELEESKDALERRLGKKVTGLCFPAGKYSEDVVRRCRTAGYEKLYASYPGNIPEGKEMIVPRNLVQDYSPWAFRLALKGGMMAFAGRYRQMHQV